MIKKENSLTEKITAKGLLTDITEEGFEFIDEKTEDAEFITFEELKKFISNDDIVTFSMGYKKPNNNKVKES